MKSRIAEELGHVEVVLPSLIAEGLAANDRAKVRMSALQAIVLHARVPSEEPADLAAECRAASMDATAIRAIIAGARSAGAGTIASPGLGELIRALGDDVQVMLRAAEAGDEAAGKAAAARWPAMLADGQVTNDEMDARQVEKLVAITTGDGDSLHRLVMDLHKILNRLAASCAEEIVDGAHAHALAAGDKPIIAAFMRGVNRTHGLKFDHPGLETTATRQGTRLIIQNDIGMTDAHVLIVTVEGATVNVTHTDVHRARAKFFVRMLERFPAQWAGLERQKSEHLGDDGIFYLVTGRYDAENAERQDAFLEAIGAALVFLIDWNKARKALRKMVDDADAIRILEWAARCQVGHRAFLELGGAELVAAAVRHAAPERIGFGERLTEVLGREGSEDFLKSVLEVSTNALMEGRSVRVVRDQIEADLIRRLERTDSTLLAVVTRQAGLAHGIATRIARHIRDLAAGSAADGAGLAAGARRIEEKADQLVVEARSAVARFEGLETVGQLINAVEQAIDELEQAAFVASLLPGHLEPAMLKSLGDLCASVVASTEALASGSDAAGEVSEGQRADFEDALDATVRIRQLEHSSDDAERAVTALVLRGEFDSKTALACLELARALERASDGLAVAGNLLHAHAMADLSA